MSAFKQILRLYDFGWWPKIRTYQRWYCGTPYEYVETFVPEKGVVVDLGCGWGMFANLMAILSPDRKVVGVDLDETKMTWARKTIPRGPRNVEFLVRDLTSISLDKVDAIVLYDVLHHLDEPSQLKVLSECFEKLPDGGRLILKENDVVPFWKLMVSHLVEAIALGFNITLSKRILFRGREAWIAILKNCGFHICHEEAIDTLYGFIVPHSLFVCEKRTGS